MTFRARAVVTLLCTLSITAALSIKSLQDISIRDLGNLLDSGAITSYNLTALYMRRINEVNDKLHAVIEVSEEALVTARQLDAERAMGLKRGPLHGIPILVKDNFATVDDLATGSGSVCLARSQPSKEATVIAKLRKAGAIILGKTNLSEFAGGRGSVSEGWSPRGNQTFGAYVEHQTPCGSSSGSGVAASIGLAAATLGTDTAGSITCPAFYNNAVAIKPTVGLTSRYGVVPLTPRQDTCGPITQNNVGDAALILDSIAGRDAKDNYTLSQPWCVLPSYSAALNTSALQGKRIGAFFMEEGTASDPLSANRDQILPVFEDALADLELAGAKVVRVNLGVDGIPLANTSRELTGKLFTYAVPDFAEALTKYMQDIALPGANGPHTLAELLECIEKDPAERASDYDISDIVAVAQTSVTAGSVESWEAYVTAVNISRRVLLGPIREHGLDALVVFLDTATLYTAAPGLPVITVPMGALGPNASILWNLYGTAIATAPGLPLGLTFVGDQWTDHDLIGYAYAYEQVSQKRRTLTPYVKLDADLDSILQQ
ncbi:amidase signature enzyme [Thozetella sp. PMI_491]|nr:amidase signature enzyme [Thozetella sp. PMI_491]